MWQKNRIECNENAKVAIMQYLLLLALPFFIENHVTRGNNILPEVRTETMNWAVGGAEPSKKIM